MEQINHVKEWETLRALKKTLKAALVRIDLRLREIEQPAILQKIKREKGDN